MYRTVIGLCLDFCWLSTWWDPWWPGIFCESGCYVWVIKLLTAPNTEFVFTNYTNFEWSLYGVNYICHGTCVMMFWVYLEFQRTEAQFNWQLNEFHAPWISCIQQRNSSLDIPISEECFLFWCLDVKYEETLKLTEYMFHPVQLFHKEDALLFSLK